MGMTKVIEVSHDGKKLYVNESVQRKIWVYDIVENGLLRNKQEFISFKDFGLDGMRCDGNGNVYVSVWKRNNCSYITYREIIKRNSVKGEGANKYYI